MKSKNEQYLSFIIYVTVFLVAVSIPTHLFGLSKLAFLLLPIPLFFINNDPVKTYIYFLISYVAFFEAFSSTSAVFSIFLVQDSIFLCFLFLLIFKKNNILEWKIDYSNYLIFIYLFICYTMIMTIPTLMKYGLDYYVLIDLKKYLYLATILIFIQKKIFTIKNIFQTFLIIPLYSSLWGIICIINFIKSGERVITWNEIYFGLSVTIGIILIKFIQNKKIRPILLCAIVINFIALILTQTRGVWLSTGISVIVYLILDIRRSGIGKWLFKIILLVISFFILNSALILINNFNIISFVENRFADQEEDELINPLSSMGNRIYESYMVYKNRTLFGHGSGARIYLYTPFFKKWTHWWSIHSEYFEILHKYGYIGLMLYIIILGLTIIRFLRMCFNKKIYINVIGYLCLGSIINLVIISITSGYTFRVNVIFFTLLLFVIANNYGTLMQPRQHKIQYEK